MAALEVLLRLARQAIDSERRSLQNINQAIANVEQRIQDLRAVTVKEAAGEPDFMTVGATLAAFVKANKLREEGAYAQLDKLRAEQGKQLQRLQEKRVELRRYELLAERRAEREAEETKRQEQKTIDDLVMIKLGHARSGNS